MAEPYATLADYQEWTGQTLPGPIATQVTARLAAASAIVRSVLPSGYEPDAEIAKTVVLTMVSRAMINPGGRRSIQMGGYASTFDQDGGLYLSDSERDMLMPDQDDAQAYTVYLSDAAYGPDAPIVRHHDHHHLPGWCG